MLRMKQKGQTTIEYTMIIIIVIGAFLVGQVYFKRGLQGRIKEATDDLGMQYDPRFTNSMIRDFGSTNTITSIKVFDAPGGQWTQRTDLTNSVSGKVGNIVVGSY